MGRFDHKADFRGGFLRERKPALVQTFDTTEEPRQGLFAFCEDLQHNLAHREARFMRPSRLWRYLSLYASNAAGVQAKKLDIHSSRKRQVTTWTPTYIDDTLAAALTNRQKIGATSAL
jgi:hypothetical protein